MAENMEALPEEVLIQRAQAQDYDAMDALMQRYKGIVRKRARSLFIIGGDQDDLMQEGIAVDALQGASLTLSFSATADLEEALHHLSETLQERRA